jgi:hypothetical protein
VTGTAVSYRLKRATIGASGHRSTYHFGVATDYGGAYGSQPGHHDQPGQPSETQLPETQSPETQLPETQSPETQSPETQSPASPPTGPSRPSPRRRVRLLALVLLAAGVAGLLGSVAGIVNQVLPRRFTAAQRQQLTDWEYGVRWRTLRASAIFPLSVSYLPPAALGDDPSLTLSARRIGLARQSSCAAAADTTAAAALGRAGCAALLRATYVDGTGSYVVTVGAAVLPTTAKAVAAAQAISQAHSTGGLGPTVHTVQFAGTLSAAFTGKRRQLSGVITAGSYVVLWTAGYADDRPREPVATNGYTDKEMSSAGAGVAQAVLSVLAAPVAAPHCPGAPGC